MKRMQAKGGFSLLEVLLALFIFSVAVVALVEAINGLGDAAVNARKNREVTAKLESLMLEATRKQANPPQKSFDQTVRESGVDYHLVMAPIELKNEDNQPLTDLCSLKASARWKDGGRDQEISAETLVYPPLYAPRP